MIARPLPYEDLAPRTGTRSGRTAALVRRKRTRARSYASISRIAIVSVALTLAIVVYLALMANVTRMNYELSRTMRDKARLVDESSRFDDQIARLESRERLARLAVSLHMHEPQSFAEVTLPVPQTPSIPHGLAFLPWLK
ncbi:MAG: hypothetical protein NVS2B8_09030 [Vulcanimicrobiaceae bacterium]